MFALLGALLLAASAPAAAQAPDCAPGEVRARVTELFFGRVSDGRLVVTGPRWERFLAQEITPRFPDGLTVLDGHGQWRDRRGQVTREPSKVVLLVTPDDPGVRERVAAVVEAYKRRFRQQSVLVLTRTVCATS